MSGSESSWRPRMSAGTAGAAELHCKIVPLGVVAEPVAAFSHCKIIPVAVVLSPFSRPAARSTPSPPWPASPAAGVAVAASAAGGVAASGRSSFHRLAQASASAVWPAASKRASQARLPALSRLEGRPWWAVPNGRRFLRCFLVGVSIGETNGSGGMGWHGLQMPDGRQGESYWCISCFTS